MKVRFYLPLFPLLLFSLACLNAQTNSFQSGVDYVPNTIVFKLLPEHRQLLSPDERGEIVLPSPELLQVLSASGNYSTRLLFPAHLNRIPGQVDPALLGELRFETDIDVLRLCHQLNLSGQVAYAEPRYIMRTTGNGSPPPYTPNDSLYLEGVQWHLPIIQAAEAWDITKGDTSIIIGIIDTGVQYDHPDLFGNIAVNEADPIDGEDNDENGFADDYFGWDFANDDSDPIITTGSQHGTWTAGVASADTDNGIGLAGTGFDTNLLAIKCSGNGGDTYIYYGYDAIIYAADRGCRVINCSWGGTVDFETTCQMCEDAVQYAVDQNALVIAAAGNNNNYKAFIPADLPNVVSVAATDENDQKRSYSNFSSNVDLSAPSNIYSTTGVNGYISSVAGTSFATPQVAGAAALVMAHYPDLTGLQVAERLRVTADNIDAQNPQYVGQLGSGRLNIYRALTDPDIPAIRMLEENFTDGSDNNFKPGDTLQLSGIIRNYLADANNLRVLVDAPDTDMEWLNDSIFIGELATLNETDNFDDPFVFVLGEDYTPDKMVLIRLRYISDESLDEQYLRIFINPLSVNIDNGILSTSVYSNGRIGYLENWGDELGFRYKGTELIDGTFGLMIGAPIFAYSVSDSALESWDEEPNFSDDFSTLYSIDYIEDPVADIALLCRYADDSPPNGLAVEVEQEIYTWNNSNYIILVYHILSQSTLSYSGLRVGIWGETDIHFKGWNRAEFNEDLNMGYVYHTEEGKPYMGIQLLSEGTAGLYAYDYGEDTGSIDLSDNFSLEEKWISLTQSRPTAGFEDEDGEDIGLVLSGGPYDLEPGQSISVSFALVAADSLGALYSAAADAKQQFEEYFVSVASQSTNPSQLEIYPNPAGEEIFVHLPNETTGSEWFLELVNEQGQILRQLVLVDQTQRIHLSLGNLPNGVYFVRLQDQNDVYIGRFIRQ